MTISFRKSFSAALLSGAVAIVTPALAGGLILAQAGYMNNRPNSTGQVYTPNPTNGTINAQPTENAQPTDSAAQAAGANAQGSMNTNNGVNTPGTYGGMSTMQNSIPPEVRSPMRDPNGIPNLYNSGTAPPDPLAKKPGTPPQQ